MIALQAFVWNTRRWLADKSDDSQGRPIIVLYVVGSIKERTTVRRNSKLLILHISIALLNNLKEMPGIGAYHNGEVRLVSELKQSINICKNDAQIFNTTSKRRHLQIKSKLIYFSLNVPYYGTTILIHIATI